MIRASQHNIDSVKERIKILYCIDQLNIGGTENQLLGVIERLDRKLFDPYLVCLRPTSFFKQCPVNCHKKVLGVSSLFSWDGICQLFIFSQYLRQEKIDIVQTFFFDSTVFGVLAAKFARVEKIISCRRDMGFWYTQNLLKILRVINWMTDRILVNSQAIKDNVVLKEHVRPDKIDVIYNGIDLAPFAGKYNANILRSELDVPKTDKIVGIVANLNRQVKRVDLFIEAAAQILQKDKQVSFIIVGEGYLRNQLEQQVSDFRISDKVRFVGSQSNVIPYLQLFDIGVLTSESEGFANSIIEYMVAGLASVATDTGGNKEIIQDGVNGYLVTVGDHHALAEKICSLLKDDDQRLSMADALKEEVLLNYSWDKKKKEVESYYLSVMSSNLNT